MNHLNVKRPSFVEGPVSDSRMESVHYHPLCSSVILRGAFFFHIGSWVHLLSLMGGIPYKVIVAKHSDHGTTSS